MNPTDPGSQQNFGGALKTAHSDQLWAQAFQMATGHPPNQLEWDEHSVAEDSGYRVRDPLEGHSEAIRWLEQQGEKDAQAVSSKSFDEYKGWLGK
jgi:erythromycin esterase-like protein